MNPGGREGFSMTTSDPSSRSPDVVASATLSLVALAALAVAWFYPWWEMQSRAPQYGQRTLVVEVSPRGVQGDVFEVDTLGHYVGIHKMDTFASLERKLAPLGMLGAFLGLLVVPFLRRRWMRLLAVAPVVILPVFFLADMSVTMEHAANNRDPDAALNLILSKIDTRLFGEYVIAQFKITARPAIGLFLAFVSAALGAGLAFARPLPLPFRKKSAASGGMAAAALLALLVAPATRAEVTRAGPGHSVQEAIDRAASGDTVRIAGVHHEHLTVKKPLRLEGEPGAVLDGDRQGTVLRVEADGVAVVGLTIQGTGDLFDREDAAIRIEKASGVRLERLRIDDALFGVFAVQADRCVMEKLWVRGRDLPTPSRGDGIRLWYSSGCHLTGNEMLRSRDLVIWYSNATVVEGNFVHGSRYGLHYMYSDDNSFHHNRFEDNEVGAAIMYSKKITLEENSFSYSNGVSADGLLLKDADDIFIRHNRFIHNTIALFFDGAPQSRGGRLEVRGNLVARNDVGIALQPSTRGATIYENAFIGNKSQVEILGTGTGDDNAWSVDGRGNYWSDAVSYDRDGDGVSEIPYRSESTYEVLADRYPVLSFFDATPAADAVDLGSRLFPIFQPRPRLSDLHPLTKPPLDDWTASRGQGVSPGLALAGGLLLAAAGLGGRLARRWVS